jgi:hypothetical protein
MAAVRHEPYPDARHGTPERQLLTVSELEQLFGPDATVELRSTRPERVEADLEVVPPRRTSRWMAPVLLVVFAAASLLGYALLRTTAPAETATSLGSWLAQSTLGPTEETPIERDYRLPPLVARISGPGGGAPLLAPPAPADVEAPSDEAPVAQPQAPEPPSTSEKAPVRAEPDSKPRASAKPPAVRPARGKQARRAAAVSREVDDRATQRLIEGEVDRLNDSVQAGERTESDSTYPPGYIEAEVK